MTMPRANDQTLDELQAWLGQRFTRNAAIREQHGRGEAWHPPQPPDAVVFPTSTEEVARIVKTCARTRTPVIAFGTGTSLEGHVAALEGGVSVDLSRMSRVLEVNEADLDCRVEAGVTRKQLNTELRETGLFFPIDPGADASLGGMAATRASGTNAVRYGTMRENVLDLTVVTAAGKVVRTGGRARKSAAGYDLTRLFVGSEGTLGIITELQLRLFGQPEAVSAAVCPFPSVEAAVASVIQTIQAGIPVARIELLDAQMMQACIVFSKLEGMAPAPTLFYEFHGTRAGVREQAELAGAIADEHGGAGFAWAERVEERNRLWQARHDAYYAAMALRPGASGLATDVCVPISALAECIRETRVDLEQSGLLAPIVGHVGDGNFHLTVIFDPDDPVEREAVAAMTGRLVRRALAMGGTCTGEHGIGYGKIESLALEHGDTLPLMVAIKRALDPWNIMNPGKIVRLETN